MTSKEKPIDFESSLKELEALVVKMESGDETLEESIKNFEYGVKLAQKAALNGLRENRKLQTSNRNNLKYKKYT